MTTRRTKQGYHRAKTMIRPIRDFIWESARSSDMKREDLAEELLLVIKKNYPHETPPKIETIIREISKARNVKTKDVDLPWSLGACNNYPNDFPLSSIPFLIKYKTFLSNKNSEQNNEKYRVFSIRKAKWIVRLQPVIESLFSYEKFLDEYMTLSNIAEGYSHAEYMSELMDERAFDSTYLDNYLYDGDVASIFKLGLGFVKETKTICKGDCNNCKYVPLYKGLLEDPTKGEYCVPKFMKEFIKRTGNKVEYPVFEGDKK